MAIWIKVLAPSHIFLKATSRFCQGLAFCTRILKQVDYQYIHTHIQVKEKIYSILDFLKVKYHIKREKKKDKSLYSPNSKY